MGFLSNTVKKSVKKLRKEYQNYKEKSRKKETNRDDKKPNGDHVYEEIPTFISSPTKPPGCSIQRRTFNIISSTSRNPSNPSPNNSLDSGISDSGSPEKKIKKLQFTTVFIHEFERNTLERNSAPVSSNSKKRMRAATPYKAKYYEIPSPKAVEIVNNHSIQNAYQSDQSLQYLDPRDLIIKNADYSLPIGTQKPLKPPRSFQTYRKECSTESSPTNTNSFEYSLPYIDDGENSVRSFKSNVAYMNPHIISSSSLDTDDINEIFSLPKTIPEPIYAQITPRSSRDLEQITPLKFSTPISSTRSSPYPRSDATSDRSYTNISKIDSNDFIPEASSSLHNEILTKETKESLNLIHQTNWNLRVKDLGIEKKNVPEAALDKKFVVNIFESRPSKRWEKLVRDSDKRMSDNFQKRAFIRMSLDSKTMNNLEIDQNIEMLKIESKKLKVETKNIKRELRRMLIENKTQSLQSSPNLTGNEETSINQQLENNEGEEELLPKQNNEQYRRYRILKKARDVECSRMAQASKALQEIKTKREKKDWLEILVAEKVLLETSERVKIITQEIRENSYSSIPEPPLHKGTLRLSDIKYPFAKHFQGIHKSEKHFTQFFLMTISHGTQMFISEFTTGEDDPLSFNHEYTFVDVAPDFEIKIKLFCLRMRTSEFFWEKFNCSGCCPTSRIVFEDYLTNQYQEKTVFQTSFKLCAETALTRAQINEGSTKLNTQPLVYGKLEGIVEHRFICENVDMMVSLSGFLDVGSLFGETYFWERKWCTLKGPNLLIYNYPQEEHFGRPVEQINLEYCFGPILTKVENCSKTRCFQLQTGRPNDMANHNVNTLKTKPNFALRKFYFAGRTREEYAQWTEETEKLLNSLRYFKKLVFEEEYDYCSKQ